jgi:hypothetical protein
LPPLSPYQEIDRMNRKSLFINDSVIATPGPEETTEGRYVTLQGKRFLKISHVDRMVDFFMTVVSSSDHWLFVSSNGALTAGRKNNFSALFPYYTDDKITDSAATTGPFTQLIAERDGKRHFWQPFSRVYEGFYTIERNLYKSVSCDTLMFEEINHDLGLTFSYTWKFSDRFGFVRQSHLSNHHPSSYRIHILDGVQNVLPHGVAPDTQNTFSNLLDAYKRGEFWADAGLAVFSLSSRLTDKAEPSEALRGSVAWYTGLKDAIPLLSSQQTDSFKHQHDIKPEHEICGERSSFLLLASFTLSPSSQHNWQIILDVNQDHAQVANLGNRLKQNRPTLEQEVADDIRYTSDNLEVIMGQADGLQCGGAENTTAHHYANVMFNTMRGGLYADGYRLDRDDMVSYVKQANRRIHQKHMDFFHALPSTITQKELIETADQTGSPDLSRLCRQYLPLFFSRRHGDPSRPWNWFSINVRNPDGSKRLDYQGNWRDIFQNWESLNLSYPAFFENAVSVFLNYTTADGYNPYRISRDGIDWDKPEPGNPWSHIGYWGDHQIIYLLKFLEWIKAFAPAKLDSLLVTPIFSHAHVPYKIRTYDRLVDDPFNTIDFDYERNDRIEKLVKEHGFDFRMVLRGDGSVLHVSMMEKLLILLLTKLSNLVPDAGIWMNTQRPEWNDANNALVGRGTSVVTLCYLRRFVTFLMESCSSETTGSYQISSSVGTFLKAMDGAFSKHDPASTTTDDRKRREVMDDLGRAGSDYREYYYQHGVPDEQYRLGTKRLADFLATALRWMDQGIRSNLRPDGLYHAYNTIDMKPGTVRINRLKEMLEGQVAVISSGTLSPNEVVTVLKALRNSALYRADQHSYILYPNIHPPGFLHKNAIPEEVFHRIPLLQELINQGDVRLVTRDQSGVAHFHGDLRNRDDVRAVLSVYRTEGFDTANHEAAIIDAFEALFDHASYTGRSGTFFAYEGLGSIYWHMISKLLLAVQETYFKALSLGAKTPQCRELANLYYDIRAGLGYNKSPSAYGAFPTDPYSHSPWGKGAKQPGMTGQVKEEILTRLGELGVLIRDGVIHIEPTLLRDDEWLTEPVSFSYIDVHGTKRSFALAPQTLAFTYCQTLITYTRAAAPRIEVVYADGSQQTMQGTSCGVDVSRHIMLRDGVVDALHVSICM